MFTGRTIDELFAAVEAAMTSSDGDHSETGSAVQLPVLLSDHTARMLMDDLMFSSYRQQRNQFPDIAPERWGRIYPNQVELEARYQQECEEYRAATMKQLDNWIVNRGANA